MNSIRSRLLLGLLLVLALAAAAMGALTYRSVLAETESLFDYQLRQMALSLRDQGEVAPEQARALADRELDFVIQIWSADGRAIYATQAHQNLPTRALLGLADVTTVSGEAWRTFSVVTGAADGQRIIQVAQPRQIRQALAADAAWRAVLPLLVLAPLMALAIWGLAAYTLRPLGQLAAALRVRDELSLQPLPTAGLPDEISPLVAALNALLERLGHARDGQRAFVADAAHELRSPLTALKLQMALVQRAGSETERYAAQQALAGGIERAAWTVEQLLALARSEPGAPALPLAPVDLVETVRQVLAELAPLAVAKGINLELHAGAALVLQGEATSLAVLVRNLVDNALRHAPVQSHVDVHVKLDGAHPCLLIDDAGPGIPAADRERVFDRFYRRQDGATGGSGLGLAIVRGIAQRHGASVMLEDSPLGGLRVRVVFS